MMKKVTLLLIAAALIFCGCDKDPLKPAPVAQVTYEITGWNVSTAAIVYYEAGLSKVPGSAVPIPWNVKFETTQSQLLNLTALPISGTGIVFLKILVDGEVKAQAQGSGVTYCKFDLII